MDYKLLKDRLREVLNPTLQKYVGDPLDGITKTKISLAIEEYFNELRQEGIIEEEFKKDIKIVVSGNPEERIVSVNMIPLTKRGYEILEEMGCLE